MFHAADKDGAVLYFLSFPSSENGGKTYKFSFDKLAGWGAGIRLAFIRQQYGLPISV
jgi:hypothetical protein